MTMTDREQELDQRVMELCAATCCAETATLLTEWLDHAVHGTSWARNASTREVWTALLADVRRMSFKVGYRGTPPRDPDPPRWHP